MYWWYTFTYDYGNGGGRYYLQLSFDKKNVTIHDIHEWTEVLNEDENKEHSDTVRTLVVPYQTSSNIITVNSNIVPRLNVAGDTLIAPVISVETNGHPIESESAHFITE